MAEHLARRERALDILACSLEGRPVDTSEPITQLRIESLKGRGLSRVQQVMEMAADWPELRPQPRDRTPLPLP